MGSCDLHLSAYVGRPARGRRGVCDAGHVFLKVIGERGRALPGVWLVGYPETHTPPLVRITGGNAGLVSHTQLQLRADGGTSGPRVASTMFEIFSKSNGGWRAVGHFRCSEPTLLKFEIRAPDSPAEGFIEEVGWWQLNRRAQKEGEGTEQPSVGASESEHRPKPPPPRRIIDGGTNDRCLLDDAVDDGVVIS